MVFLLMFFTLLIYFLLWFGDAYITLKTVEKGGTTLELNPIIRKLFNFRKRYFWIFKLFEISFFIYLILYLTYFSHEMALYPLLAYIIFYSFVFTNNIHIYHTITSKENKFFYFIFISFVLILVFFVYLNYSLFKDITKSYDNLSECKNKLVELIRNCTT